MKTKANNWSAFTRRIPINATVQQVYNAWTSGYGLESWFLRKAEFTSQAGKRKDPHDSIEAGDTYHWLWHGYPDSVFEKKKIISANGKDSLQFTFTADCIVSVSITSENGYTFCELKQENIPDDDEPESNLYVGCSTGWTFYLTNLKSVLEGGIDLRNKNNQIKNVINS